MVLLFLRERAPCGVTDDGPVTHATHLLRHETEAAFSRNIWLSGSRWSARAL